MFKALFNIIFNLLATLVQVVMLPLNTIIDGALPDLSSKITWLTSAATSLFDKIEWFINIFPPMTRSVILFSFEILIVKYTIYIATNGITKVWNLFQKLKFW